MRGDHLAGWLRRAIVAALLLTVLAGLLSRAWVLPLYRTDSHDEWGNTIAPFRVLFEHGDPGTFLHPSLYYYLSAAGYAVAFELARWLQIAAPDETMMDLFLRAPRIFVLASRWISWLAAAATFCAVYHLAATVWRRREGLLAAALLAVLPIHALYSKTVRVDSLAVFLFVYAFTQIVRLLSEPTRTQHVRAGIFCGLAISANYTGGILLPWLIAAHLIGAAQRDSTIRDLLRALLYAAFVFALTSPFVFLSPDAFATNFAFISGLSLAVHPGMEGRDPLYYLRELWQTTPALVVLAAVTTSAIVLFGKRSERLLLSLPLGYALLFSFLSSKDPRFLLPATVLFTVVAAGLPALAARGPTILRPWGQALATLAVLVCIAQQAPGTLTLDKVSEHPMMEPPDAAVLDWIQASARPHSEILTESGIVPLLDTLKEVGPFADALRRAALKQRPNLDQRFSGVVYIGGQNYDRRLLDRVDYVIISPRNIHYIASRCDAFPEVCWFYVDLRKRGELVFQSPPGVEPVGIYDLASRRVQSP